MSTETKQFRKKPVVIQAVQYFDWMRIEDCLPEGVVICSWPGRGDLPTIHTLEGDHIVGDRDWVVTGIKGERYPVKPDIFAATYEPAVPASPVIAQPEGGRQCGTAPNVDTSTKNLTTAKDASPSGELLSSPQKIVTVKSVSDLDAVLNSPEPNVIVQRDGTCVAAPVTRLDVAQQLAHKVHARCELWTRSGHLSGQQQIDELAVLIRTALEEQARKVDEKWEHACITEIASCNQSVADYVEHWEGRAEKAESRTRQWREALQGLLYLTDQGREGGLILSRADGEPITNGDQDVIDQAYIKAERVLAGGKSS